MPSDWWQEMAIHLRLIVERVVQLVLLWPMREDAMVAALNVSHPTDAPSKVRRSCAVKTVVRQNTKDATISAWDSQSQPVEIVKEWGEVFGIPHIEH